jgi:hypothetical protein
VQTESATATIARHTGLSQITFKKADHAIELRPKDDMSGARNFMTGLEKP